MSANVQSTARLLCAEQARLSLVFIGYKPIQKRNRAIFSNHFLRSNKINALNRPMTKTKFPVNEQNLFNLNCNLFDKSNNIKKSSIKKRQQENKASICIFLRSLYWPIALLHREKVWYNTCKTLSCLHYSLKGFV